MILEVYFELSFSLSNMIFDFSSGREKKKSSESLTMGDLLKKALDEKWNTYAHNLFVLSLKLNISMGLLGRQFNLERSSEDSLLLALATISFSISLFSGFLEFFNKFLYLKIELHFQISCRIQKSRKVSWFYFGLSEVIIIIVIKSILVMLLD